MIKLKNCKNIVFTFGDLRIEPNGEMMVGDEKWAELYLKKEIRESVAIGYLKAIKTFENKKQKGK